LADHHVKNGRTLICVAGKNQVAVDVLTSALGIAGCEVVALPNASDHGEHGWQPSYRASAQRMGVPIVDLQMMENRADLLFLSIEFDQILRPSRFLSRRLFNIHFSLLPKYRGCNTSIWPILNGEEEHGVTLHLIDDGVDTGPIVDQVSFPIENKTARDLYVANMRLGADLVLKWLPRLIADDVPLTSQTESGASTFRRSDLDFRMKEIDLEEPVQTVMRRIRAFTFPEYQLPTFRGRSIIDAAITTVNGTVTPGSVVGCDLNRCVVGAQNGAITLTFAPV
jgi:methionyl-tRNA formyltransferase